VHRGGAAPAEDVLTGLDVVTDEELHLAVAERLHDLAVCGQDAAWVSGNGASGFVWAGSLFGASRQRLTAAAVEVVMGEQHIVRVVTGQRGNAAVCAYGFAQRRAFAVSDHPGRTASPVLAGKTVFRADRRSGRWDRTARRSRPAGRTT